MTSQSSIQVRPANTTDPITALIAAHTPTGVEMFRPMPVVSEAAAADWSRRRAQTRHDVDGLPRHLIPVSGIRCGEYL
jgi:hypothetical protein